LLAAVREPLDGGKVAPGATLTGTGPVGGTVTASGTVAPGTGTLTTGPATLAGTLAIEVDMCDYSVLHALSVNRLRFSNKSIKHDTKNKPWQESSLLSAGDYKYCDGHCLTENPCSRSIQEPDRP